MYFSVIHQSRISPIRWHITCWCFAEGLDVHHIRTLYTGIQLKRYNASIHLLGQSRYLTCHCHHLFSVGTEPNAIHHNLSGYICRRRLWLEHTQGCRELRQIYIQFLQSLYRAHMCAAQFCTQALQQYVQHTQLLRGDLHTVLCDEIACIGSVERRFCFWLHRFVQPVEHYYDLVNHDLECTHALCHVFVGDTLHIFAYPLYLLDELAVFFILPIPLFRQIVRIDTLIRYPSNILWRSARCMLLAMTLGLREGF